MFEGSFLVNTCCRIRSILVVTWVARDQSPSYQVWTEFSDFSGVEGSTAVATLSGSLGASGALLGADSAAHFAEDLKDAAWVLPRSMVATAAVNYSLAFLTVISDHQ
jgi:choline transport protein